MDDEEKMSTKLRSVVEENDLTEFMSMAKLAQVRASIKLLQFGVERWAEGFQRKEGEHGDADESGARVWVGGG